MKYTNKIKKSSVTSSQRDTSGDREGAAISPPAYQIGIVDNYLGIAENENTGSASEAQSVQATSTVCASCIRHSDNKPTIQRQSLEEDKEVQMMTDEPLMKREGTDAEPAVKAGIQQARGSGKPLDDSLQNRMSAEFDYDFEGVRVHTDADADALNQRLGARAFTTGRDIFFKQGQYEPASSSGQKLIAHELTHVVQQASGRVRSRGDGLTVRPSGDVFEREAETQARHSVVAGHTGRKGLAASGRSMSFSKGQNSQKAGESAVQQYVAKTDTEGDPWRVSESGDTALWITSAEGGQTLFGTPKRVKQANLKLAKAGKNGSFIRLKATSDKLKSGFLTDVSSGVRAVEPRLVTMGPDPANKKLKNINLGLRADDDGTKSKEFALWADCGRSSRAVMGTDDSGSMLRAHVKIGSQQYVTGRSGSPASFTVIYKAAMPLFIGNPANRKYLKEGVHFKIGLKGFDWSNWKMRYGEIMKQPADDKEAKKMYWELGSKGRRAFDIYTGINVAADPEIGGGYTMATEYDMPGFKAKGPKTWNFHWAGIVMKDGDNNITLENYAVSYGTSPDPVENRRLQLRAYNEVNREWVFQMYGTRKKGQTFHEQHLKSGTHGTRGSTFAVKV